MEEIKGYLITSLFHNESNKYSVIKIRLDQKKDENVVIVGYFDIPLKENLMRYKGEYVDHPKYGKQFLVEQYEKILPNDNEGVIRYLSSSTFKGVGAATAKIVVDTLGSDCLELIKKDNTILDKVNIRKKSKDAIIEGLSINSHLEEAQRLFIGHGLNMKELIKLDAFYGENLITIIMNNPYQMVEDIFGIGFKKADKIAASLNISEDDPRRIESAIVYSINNLCFQTQNTYVNESILYTEVLKVVPSLNYEDYKDMLSNLIYYKKIIKEDDRLYSLNLYTAETKTSEYLVRYMFKEILPIGEDYLLDKLKKLEKKEGIVYSDDQKEAIISSINNPISLIIGGPGTGKTTILKAIINLLQEVNNKIVIKLCAPTGRASKRMSELTGVEATTIHRLLSWDLDTNQFSNDFSNPVFGDVLIIDEFSMVDVSLLYHLLDATTNFKQLIFIGDEEQLPPVSPGNVLKELVDMNFNFTHKLVNIYRQDENSGIIPLSYNIRNGLLDVNNLNKNDVKFMPGNLMSIKDNIVKIIQLYLDKGYEQRDIQVLAPKYDGAIGIYTLNDLLQSIFNPKDDNKKEYQIGRFIYRVGDKILQLKNQPDDDVYNGDIGILKDIQKPEGKNKTYLLVEYDGNIVKYDSNTFSNITLGYCISVHKAQGSEYNIVIFPMDFEYGQMLRRKLIYTGITRTKKKLYLLGNVHALKKGVELKDTIKKNFTLRQRIEELLK